MIRRALCRFQGHAWVRLTPELRARLYPLFPGQVHRIQVADAMCRCCWATGKSVSRPAGARYG